MSGARYAAVDLGAESGRLMVGTLDRGRITLSEVHRFANRPVRTPDGLHWDVLHLYVDILSGLRAVAAAPGGELRGIGIDSWAVDYGLLDAAGRLLGLPYHYRDSRTDGVREEAARYVSSADQYARTGIAQLPFNTLYQLLAQTRAGDPALAGASTLLMIPDLLAYWLTGERATEYTNATTTGMLSAGGGWARDLLARLGIDDRLLLEPRPPGTVLGPPRPEVRAECGLDGAVRLVLPATHDTGSAVVAVPAPPSSREAGHAYLSSGTWSLLGLELPRPILSEQARRAGFTNEGGVDGSYRVLTNIMGLWLVQECRRCWRHAGGTGDGRVPPEMPYEELMARAARLPSPGVVIDVDDPAFLHPPDMPGAIAAQLRRTGQRPIDDPIVLTRAVLEGLALAYRAALEGLEHLSGITVEVLHVVGGGARNGLLCQLTADVCGRLVVAGPVEATALGNVLIQALGRGDLADRAQVREVARASAETTHYEPNPAGRAAWQEAYATVRAMRAARNETESTRPS